MKAKEVKLGQTYLAVLEGLRELRVVVLREVQACIFECKPSDGGPLLRIMGIDLKPIAHS